MNNYLKLKSISAEFLILYTAPIVFLSFYIVSYSQPLIAGFKHLYNITLIFGTLILLRLLINQFVSSKKTSAIIVSFLYAGSLVSLSIYYILVLIGLKSWRRVITEELISVYAKQASELCNTLGISYALVLTSIACAYVLAWLLLYSQIKKQYWQISHEKIPSKLITLLIFSITVFCIHHAHASIFYGSVKTLDPFVLTLKTGKIGNNNHNSWQGVKIDNSLDKIEEKVTINYKLNPEALKKNLIIIVVDALRPDHLGIYGYNRNTSPNLNRLNAEGKVSLIKNVRASCSESSCGLISLASSRYVHQLPSNPLTIQKILKKYGYKTRMILSGDHTNFYGLKEAYGEVDEYFDATTISKGYYLNDDRLVIKNTQSLPDWDNQPTMIQFHLMSSHLLGKRLSEYEVFKPVDNYNATTRGKTKQGYINFYDNGVIQADAMINTILETLDSKHYLNNALVVVTADHGEELGEYGTYAHAGNLREKSINIPLLVISYGDKKLVLEQNDKFVSQVDIAPTILNILNMSIPENWSGIPIQSTKRPDYTYFMLAPEVGLYDHRDSKNLFKYIYNIQTGIQSAYNLSANNFEHDIFWKIPAKQKQEWFSKVSSIKLEK